MATNKPAPVTRALSATEDRPPSKNKRKLDKKAEPLLVASQTASSPLSQTTSRDGSVKTKKKTKKKKRSVLANQSNPHHVDNCKLTFILNYAYRQTAPPVLCLRTEIHMNLGLTTSISYLLHQCDFLRLGLSEPLFLYLVLHNVAWSCGPARKITFVAFANMTYITVPRKPESAPSGEGGGS